MRKDNIPPDAAEAPNVAQDKRALPSELVKLLAQGQSVLKEAPWVGIGAVLTALGAALLFVYFLSINYVPVDVPAILALSAAVAALALGFILWLMLCLIAPRWGYQSSGLASSEKQATQSDGLWDIDCLLLWLQLVGLGALIMLFGYRLWARCVVGWGSFTLVGGLFLVAGLTGWFCVDRRVRISGAGRVKRIWEGVWVAFWSCFPFIALLMFLIARQGVEWWHLGFLLAVWLFVVWVNALLTRALPVWALAFVALMLMPALLWSVPVLFGKPTLFVERVAELAGIRSREAETFRVPKSTCTLIQSALPRDQTSADLDCSGVGDWGSVKAQVLSSIGSRWLIEVAVSPLRGEEVGEMLRLTVPGEGVHLVRRIVPRSEVAAVCHR